LPAKLAETDADDTRYDLAALVACDANGLPRSGITAPPGLVLTGTSAASVIVGRLRAAAVRDRGAVLLANDGPVTVPLDAAPASNSRIDVIYAKQSDASNTVSAPDTDNNPVIAVAKGTASATPTKPQIPEGAIEVGTVQIPANATSTQASGVVIGQTDRYTAAAGGVIPARTAAGRLAMTNVPGGQVVHQLSDHSLWVMAELGGDWRKVRFADETEQVSTQIAGTIPGGMHNSAAYIYTGTIPAAPAPR